jgi:hypothetical protein
MPNNVENPLADNTVGRKILSILDDLFDQFIDQLKTSRFSLQVDQATNVVKDAYFITYV